MLKNASEGLHPVVGDTLRAERKAGAVPNGLRTLLDIFHDSGQMRTLRTALKRST
jgi:hypothetical protein